MADDNPFASPEQSNPFADSSVQQAIRQPATGVPEYNPFGNSNTTQTTSTGGAPTPEPPPTLIPSVPVEHKPEPPPIYTPTAQSQAAAGTDELRRKQEELERKEAELRERERQLHQGGYPSRANNFPPLPKWCPVGPCFYQDFSIDIPVEFQKLTKSAFYAWIAHCVTHLLNVIAALAFMIIGGADSGSLFGFSLLWLVLFTACSFVCWYRPLYKAFRSDSSFSFFMFFFVYFCQFCVHIVEAIGISTVGGCGWINGLATIKTNAAVAICMLVVALCFSFLAGVDLLILLKVHRIFRGGQNKFSLEAAQTEFAQGVMSNQAVRNAASNAAYGAATGAATQAASGMRY